MYPQWINDKPVSSLDLHPRILSVLNKAGLHRLSSVLILSAGDLARRTGLSRRDICSLVDGSSKAALSNQSHTTALKMHTDRLQETNSGHLTTGCPEIDSFLHGGMLVPGLTEVAGTSAAGKTQFCLQLCLTVQLPRKHGGLEGGAVYLCTEDAFPHKRLQQMTESFASKHRMAAKNISDSIFVEHAATISSLSVQMQYKLPSLLTQHSVKLVVVDSIAALFRVEFSKGEAVQRAQLLRAFGSQLRKLSNDFGAAVVCVNQVTAAMDVESKTGVKPALGLAWSEEVTMRLMMTRPEAVDSEEECQKNKPPVLREMEVLFAPHLPISTIQYYIDHHGVHGVDTKM